MKHQYQSTVFVIAVAIVMVAASRPVCADLGDQLAKLLPNDGAAQDDFGFSVAINGATAIVGAWLDDDNGSGSGSAYLFNATNGQQIAKLLPLDGAQSDGFGFSVAITGPPGNEVAIVGARGDDHNGERSGSAYLFDTSTGQQIAKLLPKDGAAGDIFGFSVAISGTTAIVGAIGDDDNGDSSGSAYLFDISDPTNPWQVAKLLPKDGAAGDIFGISVAIIGTTGSEVAIVGAIGDDDNGADSGSAYLFNTTTGIQFAKLLPRDGTAGDSFGYSVAISGTTAIVGARFDDDNGSASGSAYLFNTTTGIQFAKLLPRDGTAGDLFGWSIGISGDTAIVGANDRASGSAYLFDISDPANPVQTAKLLADDRAFGDQFGGSVAINETTAIVGASRDDDNGSGSGSAYLFDAGGPTGTPATLIDFTIIDGTLISGGLPEMATSDDTYLETEAKVTGEASETHRMLMRIRAMTAVQNPDTIDITLEAHITDVEAIVTLFLKNFDTGLFEQVGQFTNGLGVDTTNTVSVPNASRFVRPNGRIVLRVKKIVILPFTLGGFHSLEDLLEIRVR